MIVFAYELPDQVRQALMIKAVKYHIAWPPGS